MVDPCRQAIQIPRNYDKCDLWWTHVGKTSKGQKLMKAANGGPMAASHPNLKKLMIINATFGGPLWVRHPKVES